MVQNVLYHNLSCKIFQPGFSRQVNTLPTLTASTFRMLFVLWQMSQSLCNRFLQFFSNILQLNQCSRSTYSDF